MIDCRVVSPMTAAIRTVLTMKYTSADAAMAGTTISAGPSRFVPPVSASTCADASIDRASADIPNSVRYHCGRRFVFRLLCAHAPITAVQMLGACPSTSSDANDTAKPMEIVELGDDPAGMLILIV